VEETLRPAESAVEMGWWGRMSVPAVREVRRTCIDTQGTAKRKSEKITK
jgi:hypothetical protein